MGTNDKAGWLAYYLAHLMVRCHLSAEDAAQAVLRSTEVVKKYIEDPYLNGGMAHISDNECVMITNRWYYTEDDIGNVKKEEIEYWMKRIA